MLVAIVLSAVAAAIRLLGGLASWWLAMCTERARGDIAAELVRTAGPGSAVLDRRLDGSVLVVCAGPGTGVRQQGEAR
jgi:hypothetical protein